MSEGDAIEALRGAFQAIAIMAGPALIAALATGLLISVFQALTQVQEMTLAYVPKIVLTLVAALLSLPMAFASLKTFLDELIQMIIGL